MCSDLIARRLGSTSCSHVYLRDGLHVTYHNALPISTLRIEPIFIRGTLWRSEFACGGTLSRKISLAEIERRAVMRALQETGGDKEQDDQSFATIFVRLLNKR